MIELRSRWVSRASLVALTLAASACFVAQGDPADDKGERSPGDDSANALGEATGARAAIVQLFDWKFREIEAEIPTLAKLGYSHIHVSPPTLSNPDARWWARYQPVDYRVIDGPLGDETAFQSMVAKAKARGLEIVVDIVFNHMANFGAGFNLTYPPAKAERLKLYGKAYPELDAKGPLFEPNDFHFPFCIQNYNDAQEVRDGRICGGGGDSGLPDLKQLNESKTALNDRVLARQRELLQRLVGMGVGGFRFDAIKHMEPGYFAALVAGLPKNLLLFGESIAEPNRASWDANLEPFLKQNLPLKYYDFPLASTMRDALKLGGDMRSLAGEIKNDLRALSGPVAVTFVTNHDIPQNPMAHMYMGRCQETDRYGDPANERLAYAFILGRLDGLPYVYSDRGKAGADGVETDAYRNAHKRCDTAKMLRFHSLTLGTNESVAYASQEQLVMRRGRRAVVAINKSGTWWDAPEQARGGFEDGTYVDVLSGNKLEVKGGNFPAYAVSPRNAAMYMHTAVFTPAIAKALASVQCETPTPVACH
jgi:alpha-amylase